MKTYREAVSYILLSLVACSEGRSFASSMLGDGRAPCQIWQVCPRVDWMTWLIRSSRWVPTTKRDKARLARMTNEVIDWAWDYYSREDKSEWGGRVPTSKQDMVQCWYTLELVWFQQNGKELGYLDPAFAATTCVIDRVRDIYGGKDSLSGLADILRRYLIPNPVQNANGEWKLEFIVAMSRGKEYQEAEKFQLAQLDRPASYFS